MANLVAARWGSWAPDLSMTVPEATVAEIESLSNAGAGIHVEAWVMPEPTTEQCSEDTDHGPGLVLVSISDGTRTFIHELCLACAIPAVTAKIEDGATWISVEVTR